MFNGAQGQSNLGPAGLEHYKPTIFDEIGNPVSVTPKLFMVFFKGVGGEGGYSYQELKAGKHHIFN